MDDKRKPIISDEEMAFKRDLSTELEGTKDIIEPHTLFGPYQVVDKQIQPEVELGKSPNSARLPYSRQPKVFPGRSFSVSGVEVLQSVLIS